MPTGLIPPKFPKQDIIELEFYLTNGVRKYNKIYKPGDAPIDQWLDEIEKYSHACNPKIIDIMASTFVETEGFFSDKEAIKLSDSIKRFRDNCLCNKRKV